MADIIKDGTGSGSVAKVDDNNRLHAEAIIATAQEWHAIQGDGYNVTSDTINLTDANDSAILYLKNNEERDVIVSGLFYQLGASTGGSGEAVIDVDLNPTAGTIISEATAATITNRNAGSANTLSANAYKGAQGKTATGGALIFSSYGAGVSRVPLNDFGSIVLPKGKSMVVRVTPPGSNTSMNVQVAFQIMRLNPAFGEL
jgi:hypothetical protein